MRDGCRTEPSQSGTGDLLLDLAAWLYSRWWFWAVLTGFLLWITVDWAINEPGAYVPGAATALAAGLTLWLFRRRSRSGARPLPAPGR